MKPFQSIGQSFDSRSWDAELRFLSFGFPGPYAPSLPKALVDGFQHRIHPLSLTTQVLNAKPICLINL